MKRKYIRTIIAAALAAAALSIPAQAAEGAPSVSAKAAVLVEAETGRTLWEKNADEPMLIASTTKIMTALVVLERCKLDELVTIEPAWAGIEGSSMYLKGGQELTVRELLYGLMLASGNDAAVALANIAAGSTEAFAAVMNEKAAALGCRNTHFENPSGLDSGGHYSSARDMATIMAEAIKNADFREITGTVSKAVGGSTYKNHNRLLTDCEGVFSGKTGYTMAAGRTLVSCCERQGVTVICVTLSDPDDWRDHASLYDWIYENGAFRELIPADSMWTVPVIGGERSETVIVPEEALRIFLAPDETASVTLRLPGFVYASVEARAPAGEATAYIDGVEAGSVRLLFMQSVPKQEQEAPGFWEKLQTIFGIGKRRIYTLT